MSNYAMYINGQKVGSGKWSKEAIKNWCKRNDQEFKRATSLGHYNEHWFTEELDNIDGDWKDTVCKHDREMYIPGY